MDATDEPAALLALAQEIWARFPGYPPAEDLVRRSLVKYMRLKGAPGQRPSGVHRTIALAAALLGEVHGAHSAEAVQEMITQIRQDRAASAD
ncbi:MAG: hypothetical protein ABIT38_05675 [Gemmatimonadaceae bacterium]